MKIVSEIVYIWQALAGTGSSIEFHRHFLIGFSLELTFLFFKAHLKISWPMSLLVASNSDLKGNLASNFIFKNTFVLFWETLMFQRMTSASALFNQNPVTITTV